MKLNISEKGIQLDFKELSIKDHWLTIEETRELSKELVWAIFDWHKLIRETNGGKQNDLYRRHLG